MTRETDLAPSKILSPSDLAAFVARAAADGKTVALCHGYFDLLHIGHIRHLQYAKGLADILVVSVIADRFAVNTARDLAFPETDRAQGVAALDCVDRVALLDDPDVDAALASLRPHVFVVGQNIRLEDVKDHPTRFPSQAALERLGVRLACSEEISFSSTSRINRYYSAFDEEMREFLALLRSRHTLDAIQGLLRKCYDLKVLVIGDTILDEYQYCSSLGASSKDPIIAMRYLSQDLFAGGVLAVANHVSGFVKEVGLVTLLGEKDRQEDFVRAKLRSNVTPHFYTQPDAPTIVKRRFLDGYALNKLFELYVMDDRGIPPDEEARLIAALRDRLDRYDLVIAADFGHGMISRKVRELLSERAPFLAVNTQANAGNRGFHTISRYPRADFISLAEHELRLEMRDTGLPVDQLLDRLTRTMPCDTVAVTRGKIGCVIRDAKGRLVTVPAFARKVVDRIGAGDAFFSIAALAARVGAPADLVGFLGNTVGALAVEIIGNEKPVDRQHVEHAIASAFVDATWDY